MQATTPEDNSFFSREKEELPRVGLEPAIYSTVHVHVRVLYALTNLACSNLEVLASEVHFPEELVDLGGQ